VEWNRRNQVFLELIGYGNHEKEVIPLGWSFVPSPPFSLGLPQRKRKRGNEKRKRGCKKKRKYKY
jgi:hypothetical protein